MDTSAERLYSPADAGRECGCCGTTIKRLAAEIGIEPILTVSNERLFTKAHVDRIKAERQRRAAETVRR